MSESDTRTSTEETPRRQAGEEFAGTQKQSRKQSDAPRRGAGSGAGQSSGGTGTRDDQPQRPRRRPQGGDREGGSDEERPRRRPQRGDGEGRGEEEERPRAQGDDGEHRGHEERPRRRPEAEDDDREDEAGPRRRPQAHERDTDERPRRRPGDDDDDDHEDEGDGRHHRPRLGAGRAARLAVHQLAELTSRTIEGVVGVRRDGESWVVLVEVVEDPRVPSTSDIMAEFEVELDGDGELMGYRRRARYARGHTEE